jgi:hypothetical protein
LDQKWNTFGLPLYIFQLVAYCFLVLPISALVRLLFFSEVADGMSAATSYIHILVVVPSCMSINQFFSLLLGKACVTTCRLVQCRPLEALITEWERLN